MSTIHRGHSMKSISLDEALGVVQISIDSADDISTVKSVDSRLSSDNDQASDRAIAMQKPKLSTVFESNSETVEDVRSWAKEASFRLKSFNYKIPGDKGSPYKNRLSGKGATGAPTTSSKEGSRTETPTSELGYGDSIKRVDGSYLPTPEPIIEESNENAEENSPKVTMSASEIEKKLEEETKKEEQQQIEEQPTVQPEESKVETIDTNRVVEEDSHEKEKLGENQEIKNDDNMIEETPNVTDVSVPEQLDDQTTKDANHDEEQEDEEEEKYIREGIDEETKAKRKEEIRLRHVDQSNLSSPSAKNNNGIVNYQLNHVSPREGLLTSPVNDSKKITVVLREVPKDQLEKKKETVASPGLIPFVQLKSVKTFGSKDSMSTLSHSQDEYDLLSTQSEPIRKRKPTDRPVTSHKKLIEVNKTKVYGDFVEAELETYLSDEDFAKLFQRSRVNHFTSVSSVFLFLTSTIFHLLSFISLSFPFFLVFLSCNFLCFLYRLISI
jgi:hypothetical protein